MIEIEKYAQAAASTARTPPNSPARRAAIDLENAARVAAEQFVKGLEAERDDLRARLAEIEAQEPICFRESSGVRVVMNTSGGPGEWRERQKYYGPLYAAPVPAQAALDGWKLVPVNPTEKMIGEGACASCLPGPHYIGADAARRAYVNMLAAAPEHKA